MLLVSHQLSMGRMCISNKFVDINYGNDNGLLLIKRYGLSQNDDKSRPN